MDHDFLLWALYGLGAVVFGMVIRRVASHVTAPKQFESAHERIRDLLWRRLELEAELAAVDERLVGEWQAAPDARALMIARSAEEARLFPRRMRQLARRFGFQVPEPPEERLDVSVVPPPIVAQVPRDAWGRTSDRNTNGHAD